MTHPDFATDALSKLLASAGGAFAIVFFFVTFRYVFEVEFICPCDPDENKWFCWIYVTAPFLILFLIIVVVDNIYVKICAFQTLTFSCIFWKRTGRAITVGTLWIVTVLLDGDCWVCLETTSPDITVRTEQPACKKEPTSEEFASITHNKSLSRVTGLAVLCLLFILWTAGLYYSKSKGLYIYNKALYEEYKLEETDTFIDVELKELAKENAKAPAKDRLKKIKRELHVTGEKSTD